MRIADIRITPLALPLKTPYVWSQGVEDCFYVNLIEMIGENGAIGYGETTTAPDAAAQAQTLRSLAASLIGRDVFDIGRALAELYKGRFLVFGGNMPRFANQLFCGFEMAALDLQGQTVGRPVWDLLGGALRDSVGYFYFLQGETIDALVADARNAVAAGHPVIYLNVGIDPDRDVAATAAVREAIGSARLRLDANEAWDPARALRMIARLAPFDIEYIEQPTPSTSLEALGQVARQSPIPIGADQSVFTLNDVFRAVAGDHAHMIAVGPREIGGLRAVQKGAILAEAKGLTLCIHSSMTTAITTVAEHHVARTILNLDDGNQIMWQLLRDNIVASPDVTVREGRMSLAPAPGFGLTLHQDAVAAAAERFRTLKR